MEIKITEYDEIRAKLDEVKDAANFIPDVTTDEGYTKSKRVSLDVGKLLTALDKARKDKKAHYLEGGRQVDSQAKSIREELEQYQEPHKLAYKELDNLKKEREAARKAELESRVSEIAALPDNMRESHSDEIKMALESLQVEECLDFYEYTEQALKARNASKTALSEMFAAKLKAEAEAEELERLRKESEARAIKDREEAIKKEASAKADREKAEAVEREQLAKAGQIAAEEAKIAAEKRAIEAEKQAKIDADNAAEAARLAEVARQAQEAERVAAEEAKREANKKHVGNIRREAKEALIALGLNEKQAKEVVLAINSGGVPHVKINY